VGAKDDAQGANRERGLCGEGFSDTFGLGESTTGFIDDGEVS
jgi:hypothetical protein